MAPSTTDHSRVPTQSPPSRRPRRAPLWEALGGLAFLSVLPLPAPAHRRPTAVTVAAFGLVGLGLGGGVAGLEAALAPALAVPVRSALLLAALAALSGAMHLDGLMDSADGLLGGRDREERLALMRDSRVGGYGATAAMLTVLVEWSALSAITANRPQAVLAAVGLSRAAAGIALVWPPARADGLGHAFAVPRRAPAGALGMLLAGGAALLLEGARGLAAGAAALVVALGVGLAFRRRVGGITGDGCGAAGELGLAAALVVIGARP